MMLQQTDNNVRKALRKVRADMQAHVICKFGWNNKEWLEAKAAFEQEEAKILKEMEYRGITL